MAKEKKPKKLKVPKMTTAERVGLREWQRKLMGKPPKKKKK